MGPILFSSANPERPRTLRPRLHHSHIPALDGLRGFAVLAVFCYHYGGGAQSANPVLRAIGTLDQSGWSGVTLFYTLSGFLITGIVWDSIGTRHWVRNFYMRRALRILPLYGLFILIVLLAAAYQHRFGAGLRIAAIFAVFAQNIPYFLLPDKIAPLYYMGSVAVEEQFYLLWPLLLWLTSKRLTSKRLVSKRLVSEHRRPLLLCLAVFIASFLFRYALYWLPHGAFPNALAYRMTLFARAGELAAGGALAMLYRSPRWATLQRIAPPGFFVSVAIFGLSSWLSGSFKLESQIQWLYGLAAVNIACAALLVLATKPGIVQRSASAAWLRWVGRISYGIYVFHQLIVHFVNRSAVAVAHAGSGGPYQAVRFVLASVATLGLAALSFYVYERPMLRLKRFFPSPAAVPPSTAAG